MLHGKPHVTEDRSACDVALRLSLTPNDKDTDELPRMKRRQVFIIASHHLDDETRSACSALRLASADTQLT